MRLLLLPISTRRALIYCEPPAHSVPGAQRTLLEKGVNKATTLWASWEKAESGWKKTTTQYGNHLLRRIPFEEWGLKSVPSLNDRRKKEYESKPKSEMAVEVRCPRLFQSLSNESILDALHRIGNERRDLHKRRMIWSLVGMPLTAPFALIPVIPNLPFFYLVFRAYSHYRALSGSNHLSYLAANDLLKPSPSDTLDSLYSAGLLHATRQDSRDAQDPSKEQTEVITTLIRKQMQNNTQIESSKAASYRTSSEGTSDKSESERPPAQEEIMLLRGWNGKLIAERLGLPGLEIEIERAVEQVEKDLKKEEQDKKSGQEVEPKLGASNLQNEESKKKSLDEKK